MSGNIYGIRLQEVPGGDTYVRFDLWDKSLQIGESENEAQVSNLSIRLGKFVMFRDEKTGRVREHDNVNLRDHARSGECGWLSDASRS